MLDIKPMMLSGSFVQLEPLQEDHRVILKNIAQDERIWTHLPLKAVDDQFDVWFNKTLKNFQKGNQLPFVVRRLKDQRVIGTTRYYEINRDHHRITIGYTWYIPEVWGSAVNPECKFLLLKQAFETWRVNRVEFATDSRNLRSRAALKKLGGKEEGILRQHMILDDNHIRDTVIFSIIKSEWPNARQLLKERLQKFI